MGNIFRVPFMFTVTLAHSLIYSKLNQENYAHSVLSHAFNQNHACSLYLLMFLLTDSNVVATHSDCIPGINLCGLFIDQTELHY